MINPASFVLLLLQPVIIMSILYPWTSFLFGVTGIKTPPVSDLILIFLTAFVFLKTGEKKKIRRVYRFLLYGAGFFFSVFLIFTRYFKISFKTGLGFSLIEWFFPVNTFQGIAATLLLYLFIGIIWKFVYSLNNNLTKDAVTRRFDLVLAFFLVLLLVKSIMVYKGASLPADNSTAGGFILFIIAALFSLGFADLKGERKNKQFSGFIKIVFAISGFIFFIISFVSILFSFFSPELKQAAETVSTLAGKAAVPVENTFLFFMRFFMNSPYRRNIAVMGEAGDSSAPQQLPAVSGSFNEAIFYLFAALLILFILLVFAVLGYQLFKKIISWLFEKPSQKKKTPQESSSWKQSIHHLAAFILNACKKIISFLKGERRANPAKTYFRLLLMWGKFKGAIRVETETPREYSLRLEGKFPTLKKEIRYIVNLHDKFVYGNIYPEKEQAQIASSYLKTINNPFRMLSGKKI
ncbi:MAG: DUF4129 domain-containing protein [Spirochaetia bacterium]|jgi:hypothetical protein|nr:DUF4129 domain-containing protein [Spirochaetia bacterium]